jgi:hypothetical protein
MGGDASAEGLALNSSANIWAKTFRWDVEARRWKLLFL